MLRGGSRKNQKLKIPMETKIKPKANLREQRPEQAKPGPQKVKESALSMRKSSNRAPGPSGCVY